MTPERYQRIGQIFDKALELTPEERPAWLQEICRADAELLAEVEKLLANHLESERFLSRPAMDIAAALIAQDQQPLLAGQMLAHYQVLSLLGAGGMGEVYLARDTKLDRKVALKLLPAEFTQDPGRVRRFIQEAKAASALSHPNIITIYEIGEVVTAQGKAHFIVTEFIDGETLRVWRVEEENRLRQILTLAVQIASALDAAHKAGIVHRDIKPENVMVRPDGLVKVLDFGLAKLSSRPIASVDTTVQTLVDEVKTRPGVILGTLRYMSPEQARGRILDARSDIFSLGVMLYELLTDVPLFAGETDADVVAAIIHKAPPPLAEQLSNVPPELERIVQKALAKDKEQRYQNARDLQIDLEALKQESELSARLTRSGAKITDAIPKQTSSMLTAPRFSLRHLLLFVPVVLLLGGAIWWLVIKQRSESSTRSPASWQIKEVMNWASTPGEVYSLGSFSPDAQMIAFASTESGTKNIWLKQTTQEKGNAKQITDDEFKNDNPIWSPNGQEIAFFSLRGNHSGIWTMPLLGGTPTEITQLDDAGVKLRYWSKRKKIYYELKSNLFTVDLNSKQIIQITNFDASTQNISAINISPDEERIAYVSIDENGSSSLWVMQQQTGSAVQVISDTSEIRNPVWHPDGKQILYSADVGGTYQIFIASPDSRKPEQITFGDRDALALDVAADGTRILFGSSKEEADVWGINIAEPEKDFNIASGMNSELWPDVAADGKLVTFQSVKNLSQGDKLMTGTIMTKTISSKEQPVELVTNGFLPTWSPDGKQLAFMRLSGDRYGLYTIKASGGEAKLLTTDLPPIENTLLPYNRYQVSYFSWSPDSSKIVYGSARNQRRNLWTVYADGSNETQITDNEDADSYLYCPLWSADSKQIVYTSKTNKVGQDGRFTFSASVIDLATKEVKLVFQAKTFLRLLGWSDDEKALIFATTNSATISGSPSEIILLQVAIATGEQRIIATLQSVYLHNIHLSSDRRMLAFVSHKDNRDNIQMISVSGGEAKRLTANNDSRLYFSSLAWSPDGKTIFFGKQSRYSLLSMMTNFK